MQISHRAAADASAAPLASTALLAAASTAAPATDQVPRLSCCCRLSELLPLVRQAHDAARDARLSQEQPGVAA